ncbi:hypothetical protein [Pseudoalteromonas sp. MMG010]|uniref:hypothetical protein n=1 Tax=Pseudoalteromonas sp. MMG010 TaxID=2822685 RepID=UPI001B3A3D7D|nr:hypothetical protein [Pseudoalteromonas sp. MMG010]
MLLIKRLFKLFIALLILTVVSIAAMRVYIWLQSAERVSARAEEETRSNVQWLSTDKSLTFVFSSTRTRSIRVLSNAIFSEKMQFEEPVQYAIQYTLLDSDNNKIAENIYHHASKLTPSDNEYQIKQIIENRNALNVASGQSFYLSEKLLKSASAISLKLISEQPLLSGVVVRVHGKTLNDITEPEAAWLKLPVDRRERATNYLNIGLNALSADEISNAVTFSWFKMAPQGIPDVDFRTDTLYETLPYNVTTYDFSQQQLKLGDYYTDENLCASISLAQADSLKFTISHTQNKPTLTWYDKNQIEKPRLVDFNIINTDNIFQTERLQPGLVTICSDTPLLSNFKFASELPVLTSQDSYYQINNELSAEYTIDQNTHLNIELRSLENNKTNVIILDKNGLEIERYNLFYNGQLSHFDRLIDDTTQRQLVGKVQTFYLRTESEAHKVIIQSNKPVLVRMKSRKSNFNYQRTICDKECPSSDDLFDIAAWFEQQANNHYTFNEQEQLIKIRSFLEPDEIQTRETFYHSRELFEQLAISNTALVNSPSRYYQPIKPATVFNYGLIDSTSLINAISNVENTTQASVIVKQQKHSAKELSLDNATASQLSEIKSDAPFVYQNWQGKRPWVKQRVYKLSANKPLNVTFANDQPLSLVLKAYSHQANQLINLDVSLNANYVKGLTQEYSITNSHYRLFPSKEIDAFLVHPQDSLLHTYPALTKTINADIKNLKSVSILSQTDIWITVLEEYATEEQKIRWWNEDNQ